jgi:hypothetical protein
MRTKEFDTLTKSKWADLLSPPHGFTFVRGALSRELPSGVRHVILVDRDNRARKSFQIMLGFNARCIAGDTPVDQAGIFGRRYLTPGSVSDKPATFACHDSAHATQSLERARAALLEHALPWFDQVTTLTAMAQQIEDHYPAIKGQLLLEAGDCMNATTWLLKHCQFLQTQGQGEGDLAWIETQRLIAACNTPA